VPKLPFFFGKYVNNQAKDFNNNYILPLAFKLNYFIGLNDNPATKNPEI
jgi:hypothetical protein